MNSYIFFEDIIKLIKNNLSKIIKSALIMGLIIVSLIYGVQYLFGNLSSSEGVNQDSEDILIEDQNMAPGVFRIYVEYEDGMAFINSSLIEEHFLLPEIVALAETSTGVDIIEVLKDEKESDFEKTDTNRGALGVARNASTQILTFAVNVGTGRENLAVAEFYFNYLNEIEMLQDKTIYVISEPEIITIDDNSNIDIEISENPVSENIAEKIIKFIMTLIFSIIGGFFISLLVCFIQAFRSKTINYSFVYKTSDNDTVYAINKQDEQSLIRVLVNHPKQPLLLFSETELDQSFIEEVSKYKEIIYIDEVGDNSQNSPDIVMAKSLNQINPNIPLDNIIILVETFSTSKKWYKKIFNEALRLNSSKTIVQINKDV